MTDQPKQPEKLEVSKRRRGKKKHQPLVLPDDLDVELYTKLLNLAFYDEIEPLQSRVDALGPVDPDFDMKTFKDEGWDGDR